MVSQEAEELCVSAPARRAEEREIKELAMLALYSQKSSRVLQSSLLGKLLADNFQVTFT